METVTTEYPTLPIPLSNWQLREIPLRIRRLRRVAHQPSRAWSAVQVWQNWDRAKEKLGNTPLEEWGDDGGKCSQKKEAILKPISYR